MDYSKRAGFNDRYIKRKASGEKGWAGADSYRNARLMFEYIVKKYGIRKGAAFLELGSGAGNNVLLMASKGFKSSGVEIAPEAVKWAKERNQIAAKKARFILGDVVTLKGLKRDYFDLVYDGACVHCIIGKDRAKLYRRVRQVMKKDAVFICGTNVPRVHFAGRLKISDTAVYDGKRGIMFHGRAPMYVVMTEEKFLRELKQAGFEMLQIWKERSHKDTGKLKLDFLYAVLKKV